MKFASLPLVLLPTIATPLLVHELTGGPSEEGFVDAATQPLPGDVIPFPESLVLLDVALGDLPGDPRAPYVCGSDDVIVPAGREQEFLDVVGDALGRMETHVRAMHALAERVVQLPEPIHVGLQEEFVALRERAREVTRRAAFDEFRVIRGQWLFCLRSAETRLRPRATLGNLGLFGLSVESTEAAAAAAARLGLSLNQLRGQRSNLEFAQGELDAPRPGSGLREQLEGLRAMGVLVKRVRTEDLTEEELNALNSAYWNHGWRLAAAARETRLDGRRLLSGGAVQLQGPPPLGQILQVELPVTDEAVVTSGAYLGSLQGLNYAEELLSEGTARVERALDYLGTVRRRLELSGSARQR